MRLESADGRHYRVDQGADRAADELVYAIGVCAARWTGCVELDTANWMRWTELRKQNVANWMRRTKPDDLVMLLNRETQIKPGRAVARSTG